MPVFSSALSSNSASAVRRASFLVLAAEDVEPEAEAQVLTPSFARAAAHVRGVLGDLFGRHRPHHVHVGVFCAHAAARFRASAQKYRGVGLRDGLGVKRGVFDLVVCAVIAHRLIARPERFHDVQKFIRPRVALRVGEVIAVAFLIKRCGAGDDVHREPPARYGVIRVRLLGGEYGTRKPRTEGHAELDALRALGDGQGDHPGVEAMRARGHEQVHEARFFRRARYF